MARGQSCGLGERQLRPYRAEDEQAVVRFELATEGDAAQVIALQERHFPNWTAFFDIS